MLPSIRALVRSGPRARTRPAPQPEPYRPVRLMPVVLLPSTPSEVGWRLTEAPPPATGPASGGRTSHVLRLVPGGPGRSRAGRRCRPNSGTRGLMAGMRLRAASQAYVKLSWPVRHIEKGVEYLKSCPALQFWIRPGIDLSPGTTACPFFHSRGSWLGIGSRTILMRSAALNPNRLTPVGRPRDRSRRRSDCRRCEAVPRRSRLAYGIPPGVPLEPTSRPVRTPRRQGVPAVWWPGPIRRKE